MNSQTHLLSPSFNPQLSRMSARLQPDHPLVYSTSQVRPFPAHPQQQYYVTSSIAPQQLNNSFQAQQLAASRLEAHNQNINLNSQVHSTNLYKNIVGLK